MKSDDLNDLINRKVKVDQRLREEKRIFDRLMEADNSEAATRQRRRVNKLQFASQVLQSRIGAMNREARLKTEDLVLTLAGILEYTDARMPVPPLFLAKARGLVDEVGAVLFPNTEFTKRGDE